MRVRRLPFDEFESGVPAMRMQYRLKPKVAGEPDPVSLLLDVWFDGPSAIEFTILVQGARLLKPGVGVDPADARIVMPSSAGSPGSGHPTASTSLIRPGGAARVSAPCHE
jgi:hypothetical protein